MGEKGHLAGGPSKRRDLRGFFLGFVSRGKATRSKGRGVQRQMPQQLAVDHEAAPGQTVDRLCPSPSAILASKSGLHLWSAFGPRKRGGRVHELAGARDAGNEKWNDPKKKTSNWRPLREPKTVHSTEHQQDQRLLLLSSHQHLPMDCHYPNWVPRPFFSWKSVEPFEGRVYILL